MLLSRTIRVVQGVVCRRSISSIGSADLNAPREFKVVLDNETLYIGEPLAAALGWKPGENSDGLKLTLSGWSPHYFAITRTGSDTDLLARATVESGQNPRVQQMLEYMKHR